MSTRQRNSLIDDLADGSAVVRPMTISQAAAVLRASPYAAYCDRHRRRKLWHSSEVIAPSEPISTDVATTIPTNDEIDSIIQRAGTDRVWDRMVSMMA
jgi:hypothetical protein